MHIMLEFPHQSIDSYKNYPFSSHFNLFGRLLRQTFTLLVTVPLLYIPPGSFLMFILSF